MSGCQKRLCSSLATGFFCLALVRVGCSELCAALSTLLEMSPNLSDIGQRGFMPLKLQQCLQHADTQFFLLQKHIPRSLVSLFSEKLSPFQSALWGVHAKSASHFSRQHNSSASPCFPHQLWRKKAKSSTSWVTRASSMAPGHLCLVSASPSVIEGQTVRHCIYSRHLLLLASNEGSVSLIMLLYCFASQVLRRLQMHPCTTLVLF